MRSHSVTRILGFALAVFLLAPTAGAQDDTQTLKKEIEELREEVRRLHERLDAKGEDEGLDGELERLLREADEAGAEAPEPESEGAFINRGLGLQSLNPEISVAGDGYFRYGDTGDEPSTTDFDFRVLDLHVESYLDPYSKMKAAIGVMPDKAVLGEAYFTRFAVLPGLNLTAGKFRQPFGVVNRWHKHALDQVDFPVALRRIFGDGGLNQTGLSVDWSMGEALGGTNELTLQITEGENGRLFAENSRHLPATLLRVKHFRDLSKDLWIEIGGTGLYGVNDRWTVEGETVRRRLSVLALGADLTLRWEPTDRMRYANLEWRTELYRLAKTRLAPDGSGRDDVTAWGGYTSVQRLLSRTVEVGVRLDWYFPDSKADAGASGLEPLAYAGGNPRVWQVGPYVTWWQSPFVKIRCELDWLSARDAEADQIAFFVQFVFAAGPHKHERY